MMKKISIKHTKNIGMNFPLKNDNFRSNCERDPEHLVAHYHELLCHLLGRQNLRKILIERLI